MQNRHYSTWEEIFDVFSCFSYVCVVTFKDPSSTMPQLGSTLHRGRKYQWDQLWGAGWMQSCCLLTFIIFIPAIRAEQSLGED